MPATAVTAATATPTASATPSPVVVSATSVATAVPFFDPKNAPVTSFGLFIEVVGLGEENIVRGSTVFLTGQANPDAVLSVNGVIITLDDNGVFGVNVALNPGPNLLDVVVSDLAGNTESRVITVVSLQDTE